MNLLVFYNSLLLTFCDSIQHSLKHHAVALLTETWRLDHFYKVLNFQGGEVGRPGQMMKHILILLRRVPRLTLISPSAAGASSAGSESSTAAESAKSTAAGATSEPA